ncbi:MAG: polysaccharide biosynthesis protein [Vulcanimicrobiota bacterium]
MKLREKIVLAVIDFVLILFSYLLAVLVRFEGWFNSEYIYGFEWLFLMTAGLCVFFFARAGLYSKLWRYAGIQELKNILVANILGYLSAGFITIVTGGEYYSRSIVFISFILAFLFTGGVRLLLRIIHESLAVSSGGRKVIIVGANDAGEATLRTILRTRDSQRTPVGFIDDDPAKQNTTIHNIPVLGNLEDLPEIIRERQIQEIIIALPSPSLIQKIIKESENLKVDFKVVPRLCDILEGKQSVSQIRNIEVEDLLEREPINMDMEPVKNFLENKTVLITGAGGSIGSELCRQVVRHKIQKLILMGRGENSIYEIAVELRNKAAVHLIEFIGDIKDKNRMKHLFSTHQPQVVFHTAAHKHVPLMEENITEAVANNILGTRTLMELAEEFKVESFTFLSTDKAVNPTSVMGATKRMTELFMKSFCQNSHHCRFSAVRFGNVLGSRGSVVPTFRKQISQGGPVTVTSEDMTRFFMTIPEAVQLVIQAAAMGRDGEIFILDMGQPVRILDLARNMIRLSGFEPEKDIPVKILGVRPGEKLEEELVNKVETTENTELPKIKRVITTSPPLEQIQVQLAELEVLITNNEEEQVRNKLGEAVKNYHPPEK